MNNVKEKIFRFRVNEKLLSSLILSNVTVFLLFNLGALLTNAFHNALVLILHTPLDAFIIELRSNGIFQTQSVNGSGSARIVTFGNKTLLRDLGLELSNILSETLNMNCLTEEDLQHDA